MKKKILSIVLAGAMSIGLLAGCGESTKEADHGTKKKDQEEITVMVPDWAVPKDAELKAFTKDTGIKVVVNEVGWDDIRSKMVTAAAGKKAVADVVEVDWSWVGEFDAADWLEPLEVTEEDKKDMPTLSTFEKGGKILAMPYANDYRLSFINKAQYEKAGIKAPETWDDVAENMKALKDRDICTYPFAFPLNAEEKTSTSLMWLAFANDGKVFNDDGTLCKETVLPALKYIEKMVKDEMVAPEDITSSGMDCYRRILSGDASFLTGPTSFVSKATNADECSVVGDIEPILLPGKDGPAKQTMPLPEALGVTKFSEHKDAAKKFVMWYTSADMQRTLNATISSIPTRNSVLEELIDEGKIKNAGAMLEEAKLIKSPFPGGVPSYYAEMSNAMYNAMNKMALGDLSADEAYKDMAEKTKELVNE